MPLLAQAELTSSPPFVRAGTHGTLSGKLFLFLPPAHGHTLQRAESVSSLLPLDSPSSAAAVTAAGAAAPTTGNDAAFLFSPDPLDPVSMAALTAILDPLRRRRLPLPRPRLRRRP
jgi:hypothetical protein